MPSQEIIDVAGEPQATGPLSTDLAKWENRHPAPMPQTAPGDYIGQLITRGADLATLEKFMDLQERHEKNEARKAYHEAMAAFKANPPEIGKGSRVRYQNKDNTWTEYSHANLGDITTVIGQALSAHGLSAGWKTEQGNGGITVTCTITHRLGHSESTSLLSAPDNSGGKNSIQAIGSAITYLQRYTLLALTGLAAKGQDDDGRSSDVEPEPVINEKQASQILDFLNGPGQDEERFLGWLGVGRVEDIQARDFQRAIASLKAAAEKAKATA